MVDFSVSKQKSPKNHSFLAYLEKKVYLCGEFYHYATLNNKNHDCHQENKRQRIFWTWEL